MDVFLIQAILALLFLACLLYSIYVVKKWIESNRQNQANFDKGVESNNKIIESNDRLTSAIEKLIAILEKKT